MELSILNTLSNLLYNNMNGNLNSKSRPRNLALYKFELNDFNDQQDNLFFDRIPNQIQIKIFESVDKLSLIAFAKAFPKYVDQILKPILWNKLTIRTSELSKNQIKQLAEFFNGHIKELYFIDDSANEIFFEIFKNFMNLRKLEYRCFKSSNIVYTICNHFKSLQALELSGMCLQNYDIVQIAENLLYLNSIDLSFIRNIDDGLNYLFEKSKYLNDISIVASQIQENTILQLLLKHGKNLKRLVLERHFRERFSEKTLSLIKECNNLEYLKLWNVKLNYNIATKLVDLKKLRYLSLGDFSLFEPLQSFILIRTLETLTSLTLRRIEIPNEVFTSLPTKCPKLVSLTLDTCLFTEECFVEALSQMPELKQLRYYNLRWFDFNFLCTFSFLREIHHNILPKLQYIGIEIRMSNIFKGDQPSCIDDIISNYEYIASKPNIESQLTIDRKIYFSST